MWGSFSQGRDGLAAANAAHCLAKEGFGASGGMMYSCRIEQALTGLFFARAKSRRSARAKFQTPLQMSSQRSEGLDLGRRRQQLELVGLVEHDESVARFFMQCSQRLPGESRPEGRGLNPRQNGQSSSSTPKAMAGTRITVSDVLEYLASGMNQDEILADFPDLKLEDIQAVLSSARS